MTVRLSARPLRVIKDLGWPELDAGVEDYREVIQSCQPVCGGRKGSFLAPVDPDQNLSK